MAQTSALKRQMLDGLCGAVLMRQCLVDDADDTRKMIKSLTAMEAADPGTVDRERMKSILKHAQGVLQAADPGMRVWVYVPFIGWCPHHIAIYEIVNNHELNLGRGAFTQPAERKRKAAA